MTDEDVEQTTERESAPEPAWWRKLAAWGAVALVLLGALVAAWAYFRWEDTLHIPLLSPLAAKFVSIGLVFSGGALLSFLGGSTTTVEETSDAKEY